MGKLPKLGVRDKVQSCPGNVVSRAFSHLQAVPPSSGELPFLCSLPLRPFCCCAHGGQVTMPSWGTASTAPLPTLGELGPPSAGQPLMVPELGAGRFVPTAPMCAQSLSTEATGMMSLGML